MIAQYLISVDAHGEKDLTRVLNELMLEKGAMTVSPGEWILKDDSGQAMPIYEGIAAVVGNRSVFVKELTSELSWGNTVVSQDLFFDMLKGEVMPMIEKSLKERA
jgi:predicted phosphodiesterase